MAGLVLGGGVLVMSGIQVLFFWVPFVGVISLSPELAAPFTIGVMLVMANAVNLIDGLDGLAAGVVGIAAMAFFFYTYQTDVSFGFAAPSSAALVSILVAGACVGFLPHNFNPARVFMGDTGALMLGTILAAATVSAIGRSTAPSAADMAAVVAPVVIPLLILGIPIADTVFAVLRRARGGKPVTHADRAHIHHRLLELGHSHRRAVLILYAWTALFSAASLGLSIPRARGILYASLMVGVGAGVYLLGPRAGKAWAKRG
jgi:UDP-GlcNAc:undecaprenyl-phosphate GlcNAc-1-phosphate transferase